MHAILCIQHATSQPQCVSTDSILCDFFANAKHVADLLPSKAALIPMHLPDPNLVNELLDSFYCPCLPLPLGFAQMMHFRRQRAQCGTEAADVWTAPSQFYVRVSHLTRLINLYPSIDKIFHRSRTSTVQSLLLLGHSEFGIGSMEQAWIYIGTTDPAFAEIHS